MKIWGTGVQRKMFGLVFCLFREKKKVIIKVLCYSELQIFLCHGQ